MADECEAAPGADVCDEPPALFDRPSTYPPHHEYYLSMCCLVRQLMVRDKRQVYVCMRNGPVTSDLFFPRYGMCAADFAVLQILNENPRKAVAKKGSAATPTSAPA